MGFLLELDYKQKFVWAIFVPYKYNVRYNTKHNNLHNVDA
jgi:hypothetical protein